MLLLLLSLGQYLQFPKTPKGTTKCSELQQNENKNAKIKGEGSNPSSSTSSFLNVLTCHYK